MLDQVETKLKDTKKEVSLYDSKHEKKFAEVRCLWYADDFLCIQVSYSNMMKTRLLYLVKHLDSDLIDTLIASRENFHR